MSKLYKYILIIAMIIFILAQVFYINKINKEKNIVVYNAENIIYKHKSFKEINRDLNCLNEKNIVSGNIINAKWIIKVKIQGSKEELLSEISQLSNYDISDYTISKNKGKNSIILEISPKESA
jgi:hypothetical protein